jgi:hypothetical protein
MGGLFLLRTFGYGRPTGLLSVVQVIRISGADYFPKRWRAFDQPTNNKPESHARPAMHPRLAGIELDARKAHPRIV